jgi:hypothetical protein
MVHHFALGIPGSLRFPMAEGDMWGSFLCEAQKAPPLPPITAIPIEPNSCIPTIVD